jgi:lipopolysaccharide export system protein LptC
VTAPPDTLAPIGKPRGAPLRPRGGLNPRYSRFVALAKRAFPAMAAALILLVAVWPKLEEALEHVHLPTPRLDLREARDLRMVQPHYSGVDRQHRPFVITAEVARQNPEAANIVALEGPKGDMTTLNGSWFEVTAHTGLYQPQAQLLDLFGNVQLFQDKGNEFHSDSAHVDMAAGTAEGTQPVDGQGPFGHATGQGFRILNRGDVIIFTGQSRLDLVAHEKAGP